MSSRNGWKKIGIGAGVLGLLLIVFGSLWITTLFSRFEKIPSDWDQVDDLQGTFTFFDETFLTQLQGNRTVYQLISNPGAQALLGDPAVTTILANPAVLEAINSLQAAGILADPKSLQVLINPTFSKLLSNPQVLQLLQDPTILAALANPAALPQLANHPVAGPILSDPAVAALLLDPAFQNILQSGLLTTLAKQPQTLALLGDPALLGLLSNPAIQQLLADPAALSLVLDPRTRRILANPADLPTVTLPVVLHRVRRATGTQGDRIFINEQVATLDPATRLAVPGFEKTNLNLIVDQKTRAYLPGTEGGRSGLWGLPFKVEKDRSYSSWVTAASQPLDAQYQGVEKVRGLETYIHVVEVTNLPLAEKDPVTGLPLVVDALIKTWSEPRTGSTVRIEDSDAVSALHPSGAKYPRFVANVNHTEESIAQLAKDARSNRSKLLWFGTYMPWICVGVGSFLVILSGGFIGWTIRRSQAV